MNPKKTPCVYMLASKTNGNPLHRCHLGPCEASLATQKRSGRRVCQGTWSATTRLVRNPSDYGERDREGETDEGLAQELEGPPDRRDELRLG